MFGYFVRHPVAANLLMVLILILGAAVLSNIERETFPATAADTVTVTVVYPGASALDVDEEICAPLDSAIVGIRGLADFECLSLEGRGVATVELNAGGNVIQFFSDVSSAASGVQDFPAAGESPKIEIDARNDLVALIAISGITGKDGLIDYADDLSDRLLTLKGVAKAQVSGITDRELQVAFDQQALREFGLSSNDLVSAIEVRSFRQPLGSVGFSDSDLGLRYAGASRTVAALQDLIVENIAIGLILVFGTMWLFFSLREALWISAAPPLSFLGGMFVMSVLGITINMVTLIALLMSVCLIMDDSTVIAENIDKWRCKAPPLEAAAKGTMEVLPGVMASFLTTACVFGPLMFLSGDLGQILKFIPMVLLITLALSLVEGFLIVPHHLSHTGADPNAPVKLRPAERALEWVRECLVMPVATALTHWRYLTLGTVMAGFILSIGLVASGTIKVIGFPASEGDTVLARVALTSGITRARTVETVDALVTALEKIDAKLTPNTTKGAPLVERVLVQYGVNADVNDNGSRTATITVDLLESALRDVVQISFVQSELGPGGQDLDVEIAGRDLSNVEAAASLLLGDLLARPDVTEAFQDLVGGRDEVQVTLNGFGFSAGLTPKTLSAQLRTAFQGSQTDSFKFGASDRSVLVQLADTVSNITELERFPIILASGAQTSLAAVADLTASQSYPSVLRKNGLAVVRVQAQIDTSATTSAAMSVVVLEELAPKLAIRYRDVQISIGAAT